MCVCMCVQEQGLHCLTWTLALSTWHILCQYYYNKSYSSGSCPNCVANIPTYRVGCYFPDTGIHCSGKQCVHWSVWEEQCLCSQGAPTEKYGIFRNKADLNLGCPQKENALRQTGGSAQVCPYTKGNRHCSVWAVPGPASGWLKLGQVNSNTVCWILACQLINRKM